MSSTGRSRALRRLCLPLLVPALAVGLMACDKGGGTGSPGGDAAPGAKKGDGIEFAYAAEGFTLQATAAVVFEVAGAQSGLLDMAGSGKLVATAEGGKLKVTTTIDEITKIELDGLLKKQLDAAPDKLKEAAKGKQNWLIVALDGEIDEDATKAIPEVKARREEAEKRREAAKAKAEAGGDAKAEGDEKGEGAESEKGEGDEAREDVDLGDFGSQLIALPSLPKVGLKLGKETKLPTEEEEFPLGGDSLPLEVDRTYKLESIDESSGERIATVKFTEEGSGAKEMSGPQGSAFVAVEQESSGTLLFNLDRGIPVRFEAEQASALSFGDQTFEQIVEIRYEFTAGS